MIGLLNSWYDELIKVTRGVADIMTTEMEKSDLGGC